MKEKEMSVDELLRTMMTPKEAQAYLNGLSDMINLRMNKEDIDPVKEIYKALGLDYPEPVYDWHGYRTIEIYKIV